MNPKTLSVIGFLCSCMRPEEDAFGGALWAYYNDGENFEIIEREDGYFGAIETRAYFTTYEEWPPFEQKALGFAKGRVLDVGCGAGRHALYLQEKGLDVVGIDNSPLSIEVCRLRGLKKTQVVSIEEVDYPPNSFDTVLMLGNNFGLFGSFERARQLLSGFHMITSEDALIIAGTRDVYGTENPDHLEYQRLNREKGRMSGQVRIRVRFHKCVTKWFDYLMVSKSEMEEILEGTGWKVQEHLDSEGSNYIAIIGKAD